MWADIATFLNSSTIHGLAYIPNSRRSLGLFWSCVVITGFGVASYLIEKSYRGWQESPISTSVEVRPISGLTFPNVTVCPPRDTFTILNYILIEAQDRSLDYQTRKHLVEAVDKIVYEFGYIEKLKEVNMCFERDRFRHWYEGESRIKLPYWYYNTYFCDLEIVASSGEIITPFYREPWDIAKGWFI